LKSQTRSRFLFPLLAVPLSACVDRAVRQARVEPLVPACQSDGGAGDGTPQVEAGDFVVFTATRDLATRRDLYLSRLDGSGAYRLDGALAPSS
jgi:hypothetical protein